MCYILVYSIILHYSNNIEYDVGYELERMWPKGVSSVLKRPRFLGRTEINSRVSSVSKKIIVTMIPIIQNKASMKRVAIIKYYTSQKLPITEPKKIQPSFTEDQNQRIEQYSFLFVVGSTCFVQIIIVIFNFTRTSSLTFQSPHRSIHVAKKSKIRNNNNNNNNNCIIWTRQTQNDIWRIIQ